MWQAALLLACLGLTHGQTPLSFSTSENSGSVTNGNYQYYSLTIPAELDVAMEWTLTLTTPSGAAGVYVRKDGYPDVYYNRFSYSATGGLPTKTAFVPACAMQSGVWYVGVYGTGSTTFSLTSVIHRRPCTTLLSLQTTTDNHTIINGNYQIYSLPIPAELGVSEEWRITLTTPSGGGALYVRKDEWPDVYYNRFSYSATGGLSTKTIFVPACSLGAGIWYLAVYGAGTTTYQLSSVVVPRPCTTVLSLQETTTDNYTIVNANYQIYSLAIPAELGTGLEWSVTLITPSGGANLYIRKDDWPDVYYNRFTYSATGGQAYKNIFVPACSTSSAIWYVAVYGTSTTTFQLSSTVVRRPCTTPFSLEETTKDSNQVAPGLFQLYSLPVPTELDGGFEWTVTLSTPSGGAGLYLRRDNWPDVYYNRFDHSATGGQANKTITISSCSLPAGIWFVQVYGYNPTSYTITSTINRRPCWTALSRGSSDTWTLNPKASLLYFIEIPLGETQPLSIVVTGPGVHVYVKKNSQAYTNSYDYYWTGEAIVKTIIVPVSQLSDAPKYFIMIYSPGNLVKFTLQIMNDTALPALGTVFDGLLPYDTSCWSSSSSISATWSGFSAQSGIINYEIAVGTTAGATNTLGFTSVGLVNQASVDLNLVNGRTYYTSIRAKSGSGMTNVATSNGVLVNSNPFVKGSVIMESARRSSGSLGLVVSWTGFSSTCGLTYYIFMGMDANSTYLLPSNFVGSATSVFLDSNLYNLIPNSNYSATVVAVSSDGNRIQASTSTIFSRVEAPSATAATSASRAFASSSATSNSVATSDRAGASQTAVNCFLNLNAGEGQFSRMALGLALILFCLV